MTVTSDPALRRTWIEGAGRRQRRAVARARRLEHPRLARVEAVVRDGDRLAVTTVMPGGARPLADLLADGPLAAAEVRRLAGGLCSALAYAHRRGMVHGALGIASAVRGEDGVWLLWDLVPARAAGGRAAAAQVHDDVRAVGEILYVAATGAAPGHHPAPTLPPSLRAPILRCLQADPARRWADVEELAHALAVGLTEVPARRRRPWRRAVVAAALLALAAAGGWRWWWRGGQAVAAARPVAAAAASPATAEAAGTVRPLLVLDPFTGGGSDDADAWLPRAVSELLATALDEEGAVEVVRGPVDPRVPKEAVRGGTRALTLAGSFAGPVVSVRLFDVATSAHALAERVTVAGADELVPRVEALLVKLRRALAAVGARPAVAPAPALAALTTADSAALRDYVEGLLAEESGDLAGAALRFRRAAAADPRFFHPRLRLVELERARGNPAAAEAMAAEARALAAHAGAWARLMVERLDAVRPAQRIEALLALRERYPHDGHLAAGLAHAYREAGRAADCVKEAERARAGSPGPSEVAADLTWCRLESGDAEGALAEARRAGPLVLGDMALMTGRYGEAREAYRAAGEKGVRAAAARLQLVGLVAQGKCMVNVHYAAPDDARVALAVALACGDAPGAREVEAWARNVRRDGRLADELAAAIAAARGEKGAYARALARAGDVARWSAEGLDRARRFGPLLAAARAEGKSAAALAAKGGAQPIDRVGLLEPPLLYDVALAMIDAGDVEDAQLACTEVAAAAPGWAPAHYCLGRAAEARKDWAEAWRQQREFLDRWADADPDHRWVRDARRRLAEVARQASATSARP
jgi:hypothetical protein